jgi:hypothetical protein
LVPETLPHDPLGLVLVIQGLSFLEFRHALNNDIFVGSVTKGNHVLDMLSGALLVVLCSFFNQVQEIADIFTFELKLLVLKGSFLLDLRQGLLL